LNAPAAVLTIPSVRREGANVNGNKKEKDMLNKLGTIFNGLADSADLLLGGAAGASIYSAFSQAATEREMVGAVIATAGWAVVAGSRVWEHKLKREATEIRSKPAP
jgi:hypothetical protein